MAGIYIHIPFCKQRCSYCAFYSSTLYNIKEEYTDALCKEIAARKGGISCGCGSERWRMEVRRASVDLACADCGAKLRIPAGTDEDLDELCCHMKLMIPGKKD